MKQSTRTVQYVALFYLFAGSFGLISGQSIGDAARKERERRSAAENVQATTSVPNSTVSNSTQRNTAGFRDCGKELKCLVEAVEAGKPAFVSATFTFHDRDFGENSLTYYMDVAEFKPAFTQIRTQRYRFIQPLRCVVEFPQPTQQPPGLKIRKVVLRNQLADPFPFVYRSLQVAGQIQKLSEVLVQPVIVGSSAQGVQVDLPGLRRRGSIHRLPQRLDP